MHQTDQPKTTDARHVGVLRALRALVPNRRLTLFEGLRIAELQAGHLLRICSITEGPVPIDVITDQPRIVIEPDDALPVHAASGCSRWDAARRCWVISVNAEEPQTRQKFTVMHEYKHLLDHYNLGLTDAAAKARRGFDPIEYVADYFAGCVLMPKQWLRSAYFSGIQDPDDLADLFDVSPRAIAVRLSQLGLDVAPGKAARPPRYRLQHRRFFPAPPEPVRVPVPVTTPASHRGDRRHE